MSDFVAKLRARTRPEICDCTIGIHLADGSEPDEDCVKAADTIASLTAEVERLKKEIIGRQAHDRMQVREIKRLTAEVERLRSVTVVQETLIRKSEAENDDDQG